MKSCVENPSSLLVVKNLEESLEFYTKKLSLELVEKHSALFQYTKGLGVRSTNRSCS